MLDCCDILFWGVAVGLIREGCSLRGDAPASTRCVRGVNGVLGVEMYLPLHFGQRPGVSENGE